MMSILDLRFLLFDVAGTRELFRLLKIVYIFIVGGENLKNSDSVLNIYTSRYFQTTTSKPFSLS